VVTKAENEEWPLKDSAMIGLSPSSAFINYLLKIDKSKLNWTFLFSQKNKMDIEQISERFIHMILFFL
jgi:hypothetical protein